MLREVMFIVSHSEYSFGGNRSISSRLVRTALGIGTDVDFFNDIDDEKAFIMEELHLTDLH